MNLRWFLVSILWASPWGSTTVGSLAIGADLAATRGNGEANAFPGDTWTERTPAEVGLSSDKLDELARLVGGRGVVVRHGSIAYSWGDVSQSADVASAVKPVISTLLLLAVQEGKIKSVDDPVADFEPRLKTLNGGKDAQITWRHLASQTSGYGLTEPPGTAYAYNDFALALYYRVLTEKVFQSKGTELIKSRLAAPLGFQDDITFEKGKPGRLAVSVRDFARFGMLYLHDGKWKDKQLIRPDLIRLAIGSPISADTPLSRGVDAEMLPGQTSLGGGKNQTRVGPGCYSFNWWLNHVDKDGRRFFVDAPSDLYVATGHGGIRTLWIFPSLDLIVSWNDSSIADHDTTPGNAESKCNRALRLVREAVLEARRTRLSIAADAWRINGEPTYRGARAEGRLMNVRMVNAVFEDRKKPEFDPELNTQRFIEQIPDYAAHGVRAFTICLQGGMPGYEGAVNSAFEPDGTLRLAYMRRVCRVIEESDRVGVAVILSCYYQRQDQILKDEAAVKAGVANVAQWIKGCGFANVALEIANEYPHSGFDHKLLRSDRGEAELIRLAKATAPNLLVSTSGIGDGEQSEAVARAADFHLIHFNGVKIADMPKRIAALRKYGKPIVCNEDDKTASEAAQAAETCVANGVSYGLMLEKHNQAYPFKFDGATDDAEFYRRLRQITSP